MAFQICGNPVNINVSTSSQTVALDFKGTTNARHIRVVNDGTATAFIRFGPTGLTVNTTTTGIPIRTGATQDFHMQPEWTNAYAIAAAATGRVYFIPGDDR